MSSGLMTVSIHIPPQRGERVRFAARLTGGAAIPRSIRWPEGCTIQRGSNYTKNIKNLPPGMLANTAANNASSGLDRNNVPEARRGIGLLLYACAPAPRSLIDLIRDL